MEKYRRKKYINPSFVYLLTGMACVHTCPLRSPHPCLVKSNRPEITIKYAYLECRDKGTSGFMS